MFTGIVEEAGTVQSIEKSAAGIRLVVGAKTCGRGLKIGDSVAVNGCCLTAVKVTPKKTATSIQFDLLHETWKRTNLKFVQSGSLVNLERPLSIGDRLDGHFVTGHIDDVGQIDRLDRNGNDHLVEISANPSLMRLVVPKGSVAVDGISLTVAELRKDRFTVWIIPHTWKVTALQQRKVGDAVNLEMDLLGKYVARFVDPGLRQIPDPSE
jgi:riboflavin synthase